MKEKIKKFYNSDLYIKIIYGIPALVSGGFTFILLTIFTIQIIHQSFFEEEMISQYRYNHRVYHEKDMERMDRIIELMEGIKEKTSKSN